jgi:hypothetical protein
VVISDHDDGLVRISLPLKTITGIKVERFISVFLILWWQKEEEERHKKEVYAQLHLQEWWASVLRSFGECLPMRSSI